MLTQQYYLKCSAEIYILKVHVNIQYTTNRGVSCMGLSHPIILPMCRQSIPGCFSAALNRPGNKAIALEVFYDYPFKTPLTYVWGSEQYHISILNGSLNAWCEPVQQNCLYELHFGACKPCGLRKSVKNDSRCIRCVSTSSGGPLTADSRGPLVLGLVDRGTLIQGSTNPPTTQFLKQMYGWGHMHYILRNLYTFLMIANFLGFGFNIYCSERDRRTHCAQYIGLGFESKIDLL